MIKIPPRHYVIVENPVIRKIECDEEGNEISSVVQLDDNGQAMLRHGDREVRLEQPPFPLYDGEKCGQVKQLIVVESTTALRLKALFDFEDRYHKVKRRAGEEWLFTGRATYYPQVEVEVVETIKSRRLKSTEALKVRAINDCRDYQGRERKAGEEWLVKLEGLYLPAVNEQVIEKVQAIILTHKNALHVRAKNTFIDEKGVKHKAGTEWLVTKENTELYFPDVYEEVIKQVDIIILGVHDYCIVGDPVDKDGIVQLGASKIVKGPTSFFLKPGESLKETKKSILMAPNDGMFLTAKEEYRDERGVRRYPGDTWLVTGPGEFWLPIEARIMYNVKAVFGIESLGFYIFQPGLFFGSIFGIGVLLMLWGFFF
jgi:major vault protein